MRFLFLLTLLLCSGALPVSAQECYNSSGGDIQTSSYGIAYSVGQLLCSEEESGEVILMHGVLQQYESYPTNNDASATAAGLRATIAPNPIADFLLLTIQGIRQPEDIFTCTVLNVLGKTILSSAIEGNEYYMDASGWQPGTYFLRIYRKNQLFETYKLIKK